MSDFVSITEAADELGIPPKRISDLLFQRRIDPKRCVVKAGRRLLPKKMVSEIKSLLNLRAH
jgi:hypothetical protein